MKHGFMHMMWKRKWSLHNGLEIFTETEKGAAGQVERESLLTVVFDIKDVVHHEFLHRANSESLVLSRSTETSKKKYQEKKTSVVDKQLLVPPL
jgi:hypothetical protein